MALTNWGWCMKLRLVAAALLMLVSLPARAEFIVSEMILDFKENEPRARDIEIISKDKEVQYIATETYLVVNPGSPNEKRTLMKDPTKSGLMITPNKIALSPDARKLMRFLLLAEQGAKDTIYRVAVKPVIQGINEDKKKVALKVLVGYELLVIVRPKNAKVDLVAERKGNSLVLTNNGNTNAYLQSGEQCDATGGNCKTLSTARIYAGQQWTATLPYNDGVVKYKVVDGTDFTVMKY
jgi:P pilus assembly chaperone PapD